MREVIFMQGKHMDALARTINKFAYLTKDGQDVSLTWWLRNMVGKDFCKFLIREQVIEQNKGIQSLLCKEIPTYNATVNTKHYNPTENYKQWTLNTLKEVQQDLKVVAHQIHNDHDAKTVPMYLVLLCCDKIEKLHAENTTLAKANKRVFDDNDALVALVEEHEKQHDAFGRKMDKSNSEICALQNDNHALKQELEQAREQVQELTEQMRKLQNFDSVDTVTVPSARMSNPYMLALRK